MWVTYFYSNDRTYVKVWFNNWDWVKLIVLAPPDFLAPIVPGVLSEGIIIVYLGFGIRYNYIFSKEILI